ncbi:CD109 antigen-like [Gadus morhua]|uniref:CD109 antigen-like n=1 Tax=Gadus morhua TaxID=8049 RepID=UPI0011B84AF5|nr:CD109 antigen-like [Gadus morhua]
MNAFGILGLWLVELLCFSGPASAQLPSSSTLTSTLISSSQKPLYLLSFSHQLYTSRATNLSVTILTESTVDVLARLTQGKAYLSSASVTIPGGLTRIITLPPLEGDSLSPSGQVRLTLSGYQEEQLIFSNSTWLTFSRRNFSSSVQTDRAFYGPGQKVLLWIAALQLDNRPYRGAMEISVLDPGGNINQRWYSQGSYLGIVSQEFYLSPSPAIGQWAVVTTINGLTDEKVFMVENPVADPSMFNLQLETAPEILAGEDISGTVRTKCYKGFFVAEQFFFSKVALASLYEPGDEDITLNITASVTESSTGFTEKRVVAVRATFMSSKKILNLFSKFPSATGSYVQIEPSSFLPAQVSARGQVFTAGTQVASSSLWLTPMVSWFPEVCLTVYCVLPDGEVISDTLLVPIQQPNHVSLKWNEDLTGHNRSVSFTVTVQDPRSQVLILVTTGTPEAHLPLEDWLTNRDTECNTVVLSDGQLLGSGAAGQVETEAGPGSFQRGEQWSNWTDQGTPVTRMYVSNNLSDTTWVSPSFTIPDTIYSWRVEALVMSDELGLGFSGSVTTTPLRESLKKLFYMELPERVIRGEEVVLELLFYNILMWDLEVILLVEQNEAFEFVLAVDGDLAVVNARKVTVGPQSTVKAFFPIRPLALGEMEISAGMFSAEDSRRWVQTVLVKPEGVARSYSQTLLLELAPNTDSNSWTTSFSFPPNVVPGSQRVHVAVVGDLLGLSMGGLESLVSLPRGCGEQNFVSFASSVTVLEYLEVLENGPIKARALAVLEEGFRKERSYQRDDGSFSAFGIKDSSGSTWLTAIMLRTFLRAQPYMSAEQGVELQGVVRGAASWLLTHQGPGGVFAEAGHAIHTEMRRCRDDCPATLTAFVVMALLEDPEFARLYKPNITRALDYLKRVVLTTTGNYTLCMMAYALVLEDRPAASRVLAELRLRANYLDGDRWSSSEAPRAEGAWGARSAEVEMVSYVLLALSRNGRIVEGFPLMRWLSQQRNPLGGYGSTQDTVVAIQALAAIAVVVKADAINLTVQVSSSTMRGVSLFRITSTNFQLYHSKEIHADQNVTIDLVLEGKGFVHFQMNVFYNVESARDPTEKLQAGTEAFSLDVEVLEALDDRGDRHHSMVVSICTRVLGTDGITQTGMVLVDVGLLSGFLPLGLAAVDPIRKVETPPGRAVLYLDSLTLDEVCINVTLTSRWMVARVQDATVRVYDYYEPGRGAMRTYNSERMKVMDSCNFCGRDCSRCRSGISLVSSTISLHSPCSLGCLFALITLLFV